MTTYEIAPWPRAEHFARVFKIRSGTQLGTATAIDIDRRQYLVTALHVVEHALDVLCVDVRLNEEWISHPFGLVAAYPEADIAIFALQRRLTLSEYPIDISASGCIAGQEVFFLGYPLGIQGHLVEPGFPLPVVKRGTAALFEPTLPHRRILLSGSANPGFSGGPVYFCDHKTGATNLMAILIESLGYCAPVEDVWKKVIGTVTIDSGLIRCTYIDLVLDLVRAKPIGLVLD